MAGVLGLAVSHTRVHCFPAGTADLFILRKIGAVTAGLIPAFTTDDILLTLFGTVTRDHTDNFLEYTQTAPLGNYCIRLSNTSFALTCFWQSTCRLP